LPHLCPNPPALPIAKEEAEKRTDVTLQVLLGTWFGKKVRVPVGHSVIVGRGPRSDINLPNDPYVSRAHFSLDWDDTACWVSDLNSHNGTFLNDKNVQRARLRDGDRIRVGWTVLEVRLGENDSFGRETAAIVPNSGYL
jgi:serine/threonine-protein kinase